MYFLHTDLNLQPFYCDGAPLCQAEISCIERIGRMPDITITELSKIMYKTPSACSQIVRKLVDKELVEQLRNRDNKRIYNLRLTEKGRKIREEHQVFMGDFFHNLIVSFEDVSEEELEICLKVNERMLQLSRSETQRLKDVFAKK